MTDEEKRLKRNEAYRARYRRKHPKKVQTELPTETNGLLMTEKIELTLPAMDREERENMVMANASDFQKSIRCQWGRDRKPKSIIIVEGRSKKNNAVFTVECVLGQPFTPELREYFKAVCSEKVRPACKKDAESEKS